MAFDRQIAAITIYCEASSASQDERDAIAHVMVNRLKQPQKFGKTLAGVCLKRYQFSEWNADPADNSNLMRAAEADEDTDPAMLGSQQAIALALNGWPDPTNGATHFYAKGILAPSWTIGAELSLVTDNFRFYRNVK